MSVTFLPESSLNTHTRIIRAPWHVPLVSINRVPLNDPVNIHSCDIALLKYFWHLMNLTCLTCCGARPVKVLASSMASSWLWMGAKYSQALILSTKSLSPPCSLTTAPASWDRTRIFSWHSCKTLRQKPINLIPHPFKIHKSYLLIV